MSKGSTTQSDAPGVSYTDSDVALFESLMNYPTVDPGQKLHDGGPDDAPPADAFQYTEQDTRLFQELMTFEPRHASREPRRRERAFVYTDEDNELFDGLMYFERGSDANDTAGRKKQPEEALEPVTYTQQDLESFQKLTPGGQQDVEEPDKLRKGRSRSDRDVGHIRIVDFDNERLRQRRNRTGREPGIKVRFFD